jgi:hypothetical protein
MVSLISEEVVVEKFQRIEASQGANFYRPRQAMPTTKSAIYSHFLPQFPGRQLQLIGMIPLSIIQLQRGVHTAVLSTSVVPPLLLWRIPCVTKHNPKLEGRLCSLMGRGRYFLHRKMASHLDLSRSI